MNYYIRITPERLSKAMHWLDDNNISWEIGDIPQYLREFGFYGTGEGEEHRNKNKWVEWQKMIDESYSPGYGFFDEIDLGVYFCFVIDENDAILFKLTWGV